MTRRVWLAAGLVGLVVVVIGSVFVVNKVTGGDDRVQSANDLASQIGCESFEVDRLAPQAVAQVAGAGTCELAGQQVSIFYYTSNDDRDEARDQMKGIADLGMLKPVRILFGGNWSVSTSDGKALEALEALQDDFGGELIG